MPERLCHTACVKGNNYLLDFLRGLVQFRIITGSLEVINTGAHIHLICQLPIQRNITRDGMYQRKCFSLSVQGHLHSHCWLGCVIILKTFINVLGQKSRVSIWHFCRRCDETGELIAAHSCRWLNSARGEDREEHRDTWNITAHSCCVCIFIFICVSLFFSHRLLITPAPLNKPPRNFLPTIYRELAGVQALCLCSPSLRVCWESNTLPLLSRHLQNTQCTQIYLFISLAFPQTKKTHSHSHFALNPNPAPVHFVKWSNKHCFCLEFFFFIIFSPQVSRRYIRR